MTRFYQKYVSEGIHKLNASDLELVRVILFKAYSDDVLIVVLLPMLESEDKEPTFVE